MQVCGVFIIILGSGVFLYGEDDLYLIVLITTEKKKGGAFSRRLFLCLNPWAQEDQSAGSFTESFSLFFFLFIRFFFVKNIHIVPCTYGLLLIPKQRTKSSAPFALFLYLFGTQPLPLLEPSLIFPCGSSRAT